MNVNENFQVLFHHSPVWNSNRLDPKRTFTAFNPPLTLSFGWLNLAVCTLLSTRCRNILTLSARQLMGFTVIRSSFSSSLSSLLIISGTSTFPHFSFSFCGMADLVRVDRLSCSFCAKDFNRREGKKLTYIYIHSLPMTQFVSCVQEKRHTLSSLSGRRLACLRSLCFQRGILGKGAGGCLIRIQY